MAFTVKEIAKLSSVSIRTLHYYDEIGLLKPAYTGENQYRYYEHEQLLILQQILFYREIGMPLNDIKVIVTSDEFNKLTALESHREVLASEIIRKQALIETIDKTIAHLKGNETMKLDEIFHGFTEEKQKLYKDFLIDSGIEQSVIDEIKRKVKHWGKDNWIANKKEGDQIHAELVDAIENGLSPESVAVQAIIDRHYKMTKQFWTPDRNSYVGLSELYGSQPDFVKFYAEIHPQLLGFLQAAMKVYAEGRL